MRDTSFLRDRAAAALKGEGGLSEVAKLYTEELFLDDLDGVAGGVITEDNTYVMKGVVYLYRDWNYTKDACLQDLADCFAREGVTDLFGLTLEESVSLINQFWDVDMDELLASAK